MGVKRAVLKSDSQVITGNIDKSFKARDPRLEKYLQVIRRMESHFEGFSVKNINRTENDEADAIARRACSEGSQLPPEVFFEILKAPSVELQERAVLSISPVQSDDWRSEVIAFLSNNYSDEDEAWVTKMAQRIRQYKLISG